MAGFGNFGFNFYKNPNQNPSDSEPPIIDTEAKQANTLLWNGMKRRLILLGALILIAIVYSQCVVITKPNEYVVIQQFGEIKHITTEPGISLKLPIIQTTRTLPSNVRLYDIPISDVITQDKKTMVADSFVLWRVSDPAKFIRTLSGNIVSAETRISNISYNSMKNVISRLPQSEIISGRDTLALQIFDNIGDTLDQYGVELIAIETKHMDLPDDNKQAVYTRMISERNNIAASYQAEGEEEARKIRTETDKTVSIMLSQANASAAETIAEGERQYMEILAQAYNTMEKSEFYAFSRALDAAKESLNNGNTTLILSGDSPITQIFYNIE
ncbi:protease modulator HflC [Ruminococcaceae bacterium OttesenSCG-928-L11]|nr:protease modulator HflC [Ruminococcaceae bacterium OttesenSCG-928-L11]